jgi:hypothetical protein
MWKGPEEQGPGSRIARGEQKTGWKPALLCCRASVAQASSLYLKRWFTPRIPADYTRTGRDKQAGCLCYFAALLPLKAPARRPPKIAINRAGWRAAFGFRFLRAQSFCRALLSKKLLPRPRPALRQTRRYWS